MKKAKLMLTGIAVLAVVGAALAFKAKSAFNVNYCTSNTSGTCPDYIGGKTPGTSGTRIYFVTTNGTSCPATPMNCSGNWQDVNLTTANTFPLVND